jgi:hypothetical protein
MRYRPENKLSNFNASVEVVHEHERCVELLCQCDCRKFSRAERSSCGVGNGIANVQPGWWRGKPRSNHERRAEMLQFVDNGNRHNNLSVKTWK